MSAEGFLETYLTPSGAFRLNIARRADNLFTVDWIKEPGFYDVHGLYKIERHPKPGLFGSLEDARNYVFAAEPGVVIVRQEMGI